MRDNIKTTWCHDNHVQLIRIPYVYNTYSSIKEYLNNYLLTLKS